MDLPGTEVVFKVFAWSITGVAGWIWWSLGRSMVRRPEFEAYRAQHEAEHAALTARLAQGDARFAQVESTLRHLPTKEETLALRIQMETLAGDLKVTQALMKKVEEPVRNIVENALAERVR